MNKVLIITYYWPPSGGGGVQRWLKLSKYLPDFNWKPIVYTPSNPSFYHKDYSLLKEIKPQITVWKRPIFEPFFLIGKSKKKLKQGNVKIKGFPGFLQNIVIWARGNLIFPDSRVFWVLPSFLFLIKKIKEENIDLIITTGPPHSLHLIGYLLAKRMEKSWIIDFRDPWSDWDILDKLKSSKFILKLHKGLEKFLMNRANLVITVSNNWQSELQKKTSTKVRVLTNGFDHVDFEERKSNDSPKFKISYFGMLNSFRNPEELWRAISEFVSEMNLTKDQIEIRFTGIIDDEVLNTILQHNNLKGIVKTTNSVPHLEVINEYFSSNVLLLILNESKNSKGHLPGKLFEYIASGKMIIAIGEKGSDAEKILSETKNGFYFHNSQKSDNIKNALIHIYKSESEIEHRESGGLKKHPYSRYETTKTLARFLNEVSVKD